MSNRFHVGEDGPKPCSAAPGNCPLDNEGQHFDKKEEAQQHYEKLNSNLSLKTFRNLKKDVDTAHVVSAGRRIRKIDRDLKLRDERQFKGTVYQGLLREVEFEAIEDAVDFEAPASQASLGLLRGYSPNEDSVIGVSYSVARSVEEITGISDIKVGLENGVYKKNDVNYTEEGDKGVLTFNSNYLAGANKADVETETSGGVKEGTLTIVSHNKAIKSVMRKAKEAHNNGTLRVETSADKALFYDDRDIGRNSKIERIKIEETVKHAEKMIEKDVKILERNGMESCRVDISGGSVDNLKDVRYVIDYRPADPSGETSAVSRSKWINGYRSAEEIRELANNV